MTTGSEAAAAPRGPWLRIPLAGKILFWFFCNVVFLVAVAAIVTTVHLQLRVEALLAGRADERLQVISTQLATDLRARPQEEWAPLLEEFARTHQVQIGVFRNDGSQLAGEIEPLPPEVVAKLSERPPPGLAPPPDAPPDFPPDEARSQPRPNPPNNPPDPRNKFAVRAGQPPAYWIGMRARLSDPAAGRRYGATTFILRASSLGAGGLLFDYRPLALVGAAVLVVSVLFWIPLVRGITGSIRKMNHVASAIARGEFGAEVRIRRADELGTLGRSLDHMAGRLREFVTGQKRFLGDIAHELCSPLARMEMALGVLEQRADEKQRSYVEDVREEVRHMSALVSELLSFAKADVGGKNLQLKALAVSEIVFRAVERESPGGVGVVVNLPPNLRVLAEPDLLTRAIANVVRNALRYANPVGAGANGEEAHYSFRPLITAGGHAAGPITITAAERDGHVTVSISDCGPGVPEETLHRLFDPFFRPEAARTRESGGTGLGLAIVKSCVEACGGSVAAHNVKPHGLQVDFKLRSAS